MDIDKVVLHLEETRAAHETIAVSPEIRREQQHYEDGVVKGLDYAIQSILHWDEIE
jgi:hypothetical protein